MTADRGIAARGIRHGDTRGDAHPKPGQLSNTASVAATSPVDSTSGNNTATATTTVITTVQSSCQPRPNVGVTTSRGAPGQLNATIAAQTSVGTPTNSLSSVRFTRNQNAAVQLNGSPAPPSGPSTPGECAASAPPVNAGARQNPAIESPLSRSR